MEFNKQEGTSFVVAAKPFRPKDGGKEFLPADLTETQPVWGATPINVDGTDYHPTLEPLGDGMKCKITLPSLPDTATEASAMTVQLTVDAKRGTGVVSLTRSFTVNVLPEEPTDIDFEEEVG